MNTHVTVGNEAKFIRPVHTAVDKTSKQEKIWARPYSGKRRRNEKEVVNFRLRGNHCPELCY